MRAQLSTIQSAYRTGRVLVEPSFGSDVNAGNDLKQREVHEDGLNTHPPQDSISASLNRSKSYNAMP